MITVRMDEDMMLDMLVERVRFWTKEEEEVKLFEKMYSDYLDDGVFEGGEFDVMQIVDNDWVNNCGIIHADEADFNKLVELYKAGDRDVSCEDFKEYRISFIEAVDDEDDPTMFLVRF